jgi:hypothetical protein
MRFAPEDLQLRACVDASYGINVDCKSHYGVLLRVGHTSATIHARSSIIKVVTRSALESELYATTLQQADTLTKPTIGALFLQGVNWLMGITHTA